MYFNHNSSKKTNITYFILVGIDSENSETFYIIATIPRNVYDDRIECSHIVSNRLISLNMTILEF